MASRQIMVCTATSSSPLKGGWLIADGPILFDEFGLHPLPLGRGGIRHFGDGYIQTVYGADLFVPAIMEGVVLDKPGPGHIVRFAKINRLKRL